MAKFWGITRAPQFERKRKKNVKNFKIKTQFSEGKKERK